jgi:CTP:molybdopterin cytidylyltransferase MocA
MDWTLIVLAAGMGSRFGGLKQLTPVGPTGEVVLDYSVHDAMLNGCRKVVFVIRPEMEGAFREQITARFADRVEVAFAFQELMDVPEGFVVPAGREKPWGTGHATLAARKLVDTPFVVINADDFYGQTAYREIASFFEREAAEESNPPVFSLVSYRLAETLSAHGAVSRGVCRGSFDGRLTGITEMTAISRDEAGVLANRQDGHEPLVLTGEERVSMNFWGFTPAFFPMLESRFREFLEFEGHEPGREFYLPYAVTDLLVAGRAQVLLLLGGEDWFGMTYPGDREETTQAICSLVDAGKYPASLWK